MQSLYELLKANKGLPVSDSYAALWGKSAAESGIKTLTGRLPLYFKTTETKLRDWIIYGNNDVGKNQLDITGYNGTHYGVRWYEDNGQLKASGTYTDSAAHTWPRFYVELSAGTYTLSGSPDYEQSGVRLQIGTCTDALGSDFSVLGYDSGTGYTFTLQTGSWVSVRVYTASSLYRQTVDLTLPLMLRKADTSEAFEPYQIGVGKKTENGYVLNIIVGFAPIPEQPVTHIYSSKTINLGESPLTEGRTVSMSEFGDILIVPYSDVFIAAVESLNFESPLSYNQPEMMIKYKE